MAAMQYPGVMPGAQTGAMIPGQQAPVAAGMPASGNPMNVGGIGTNVTVNPQNIANSEAYQFLQQQGQQGLERGAAARGTLLTGGTLKDALRFNSGLASQEYGNEFARQFGMAEGNANRTLSGLNTLYGGGLTAARDTAGLYGDQGQAGAAGTVAGANAINQGIGGVAGTLGDYFAKRRAQQQAAQAGAIPGNYPAPTIPVPAAPGPVSI